MKVEKAIALTVRSLCIAETDEEEEDDQEDDPKNQHFVKVEKITLYDRR